MIWSRVMPQSTQRNLDAGGPHWLGRRVNKSLSLYSTVYQSRRLYPDSDLLHVLVLPWSLWRGFYLVFIKVLHIRSKFAYHATSFWAQLTSTSSTLA